MKKNMGTSDKAIRFLLAITILTLYFFKLISGTWAVVLLIVSAIFIITSFINFCPLYFPFGFSTRKKRK